MAQSDVVQKHALKRGELQGAQNKNYPNIMLSCVERVSLDQSVLLESFRKERTSIICFSRVIECRLLTIPTKSFPSFGQPNAPRKPMLKEKKKNFNAFFGSTKRREKRVLPLLFIPLTLTAPVDTDQARLLLGVFRNIPLLDKADLILLDLLS